MLIITKNEKEDFFKEFLIKENEELKVLNPRKYIVFNIFILILMILFYKFCSIFKICNVTDLTFLKLYFIIIAIFSTILSIYSYLKDRQEYLNISKHMKIVNNMDVDDALDYICDENNEDIPFYGCSDLIYKYKLLKKFLYLTSKHILNISYIKNKENENSLIFILEYKDNKKEYLIFDEIKYQYKAIEEDELIYNDGIITLYSKNL